MMQGGVWQAKLKAASVSFAVWLLTSTILVLCTLFLWFPKFLFWADGGFDLLKIIISIDIILGPVLLFVIFNPKKTPRMLLADIGLVLLLQVCCFGYGLFTLYNQRPAFVSYDNGQFQSVRGSLLDAQDPSPERVAALKSGSPSLVVTSRPTKAQLSRVMFLALHEGIAPHAQVELLQPLAANSPQVFAESSYIQQFLQKKHPELLSQVDANHANAAPLQFAWFDGRSKSAILVFDSKATFLGALTLPSIVRNPSVQAAVPQGTQPLFKKRIDKSTAVMSLVRVPSET